MNNELMNEYLESYKSYIVKIPNGCQKIADFLRENAINEAMISIGQFTEGMKWVVEMNKLLNQNGVMDLLGESNIYEYLNEINNGLVIEDFVIVSDMFEYEIKPFFEEHINNVESEK